MSMKFLKNFALATMIVALPTLASAGTANLAGGETKVYLSSGFVSALPLWELRWEPLVRPLCIRVWPHFR